MKKIVIATMISAAGILSAGAATTITATNTSLASTRQIILSAGVPLTSAAGGVYQVGVFAGDTFNSTMTLADFTSAGSVAFSVTEPGCFGAFGSGGVTVNLPNLGAEPGVFVGRPIYVVIPGVTGTSSEGKFIAFSTPNSFAFESALDVGTPVGITNANLTLVNGALVPAGNTGLTGALASANGGTAITFIPEPSAALLGALGALGLLRRRRI